MAAIQPGTRTIFGHPRGLAFIAATELWDRISFHGMQALLTLYMAERLLLPGHVEQVVGVAQLRSGIEWVTGPLSVQSLATQVFGLYAGLVYLTPVFGGWLGDRVLGRTRAVVLGGLLMTAGHFCLAFDASFLLALLLLIVGAGFLRGNLAPQLGELYPKTDQRRDTAFQIYGSAVNIGAFLAPLITGALGQVYGWHFAFAFAGVGMLIGVIVYVSGRRDLPPEPERGPQAAREPLQRNDWRIVAYLIAFVPLASMFWIAQSQVWNTYNIWVRDHVDLTFGHWTMPVVWLQSLDGIAPFLFLPIVLPMWHRQRMRGREPNEFTKMAIGCFIFGAATMLLAGGSLQAGVAGRASLLWSLGFHLISNIGWLFFSPIAQAFVTRAAPASVNATMLGVYYLSIFFGSIVSGRLGGLYERLPAAQFWTLHAAIVAGGGVLILLLGAAMRPALRKSESTMPPALALSSDAA